MKAVKLPVKPNVPDAPQLYSQDGCFLIATHTQALNSNNLPCSEKFIIKIHKTTDRVYWPVF